MRWSAPRKSRATCGAPIFARSMLTAEVGTGRLKSRDARTACASLRQVAADGRAASEGGVPSEGNAAEGMLTERRGAALAKGTPTFLVFTYWGGATRKHMAIFLIFGAPASAGFPDHPSCVLPQ